MRKKCKCGKILSDTVVPNDVIYWTYPVEEKEKIEKTFHGEYPKLTQIAIWYCNECKRFYYWSNDWKLFTYNLNNILGKNEYTIDWNTHTNMYYSYNDIEEDEIIEELNENGNLVFPRKVIRLNDNTIIIKNKTSYKIYTLEEIEILKQTKE